MAEHITSQDPPLHTRTRGLLSRLITPKRLKENEDFMWRLADQQLDTFIERGIVLSSSTTTPSRSRCW